MTSKPTYDQITNAAYTMLEAAGGDVSLLPLQFQNLVLIHSGQALIDNGGLEYFFYNDFPFKPPYGKFVEAYKAIGATDAARILVESAAFFQIENPELHIEIRQKYIDSLNAQDEFSRLSDIICGDDSIWALLEKYAAN
nr:DUF4375 domain-containing protein [uncultured Deefgea sp.]